MRIRDVLRLLADDGWFFVKTVGKASEEAWQGHGGGPSERGSSSSHFAKHPQAVKLGKSKLQIPNSEF